MNSRALRWALPLALTGAALAADPVLRIVRGGPDDAALLANGDFAAGGPGGAEHWRPAPGGCAWAAGEGRGGSPALRCESPAGEGWFGASQAVVLNRATGPLVVSGWSKAEGVGGHVGSDYSLYVDLVYTDGTPLWGRTGNFRCGTHDWERREFVIVPEKPVGTLTLHCLFRGRAGRAWFDDVGVAEIRPGAGATVFQGLPVQPAAGPAAPAPPPEAAPAGAPAAGLQATVGDQRVVSLRVGGTEWIGAGPAGFMARDAAADSDFFGVGAEPVPGLDLAITGFSSTPGPDHVVLDARLVSTRPQDRAVTLVHALPLAGGDWRWGDDLRRSRATAGGGEFTQVAGVQAGATGGLSVYPIAAVWNDRVGLALGIDLGRPALYRVGYHAALGMLFVACDLGLVGDTRECPHGADLRVVLFRFDPRWGFRGAWRKYMEIFPDYFAVRARDQGLWMPFTDVSTVAGWEDFGFRFHEGDNNVPWDDAHGVLSFRYTEPMTWWMAMDPALPRTPAAALRLRGELARGADAHGRRMAQAAGLAGMLDEAGEPCLQFHDTPWCNGAVWSLNPNPWLEAPPPDGAAAPGQPAPGPAPNAATVHWNPALRERLYGPQARGRLDGEYLDSLEGYVTAELNFRREHFRHSTVPLTFDPATRRPALFKGLAVFEFTRWMAADVHRMGGLMFANGVPYRFGFLCPWLDVLGTETNWMRGADYQPAPLEQMDLWRTCSGAKPYLLLMNTDYDRFTPERVERYFQRALFYGMFPGMFSHNAADNPYWQTPKWYNRDRPLFRRYLPVVKRVAEAGWHPVPHATCENPRVLLERFGPDAAGHVFLTVFNDTPEPQAGTVQVDRQALGLPAAAAPRELLSGAAPAPRSAAGWAVHLHPHQVEVLHFDPAATTGNAD